MSIKMEPLPGMDAEQEAYQRLERELKELYDRIVAYINATKRDYKAMLEPLIAQRQAVQRIRDGVYDAAHDTHVGAPQCREALDAVLEKLDQAISRLSGL